MAENIEGAAARAAGGSAHYQRGAASGFGNAIARGYTMGQLLSQGRGGRGGRSGGGINPGMSAEDWYNLDLHRENESQRLMRDREHDATTSSGYIRGLNTDAPEGRTVKSINFRGNTVAYENVRDPKVGQQMSGVEPKASEGASSRAETSGAKDIQQSFGDIQRSSAQFPSSSSKPAAAKKDHPIAGAVGERVGAVLGGAAGALVPVAGETGASEAVGATLGAAAGKKVGEAAAEGIDRLVEGSRKRKAAKAAEAAAPAAPSAPAASPKPRGGSKSAATKSGAPLMPDSAPASKSQSVLENPMKAWDDIAFKRQGLPSPDTTVAELDAKAAKGEYTPVSGASLSRAKYNSARQFSNSMQFPTGGSTSSTNY